MRRGGLLPPEAEYILLAERTGWTLDYVRNMDKQDYLNVRYVIDGLDTARNHNRIRAGER